MFDALRGHQRIAISLFQRPLVPHCNSTRCNFQSSKNLFQHLGHADVVEDRGIPCLRGSWQSFLAKVESGDQEFIGRYCNQFDCITCWDTIEHYCKGKDVWNVKVIKKTYRDLFKFAHSLLNKNSECGSFWSSTLHQSRRLETNPLKWRFWLEWGNCYIMNTMYNGEFILSA